MEPTIYDISAPGRRGVLLPDVDVPETPLPTELLRTELNLPEVGELQAKIPHACPASRSYTR
jgi:glycine dehydrogenase subunit 2